jgi:hypothetical protein
VESSKPRVGHGVLRPFSNQNKVFSALGCIPSAFSAKIHRHCMIYFDHNATTPVLPEVFEAMRPYFCDEWGNPSSAYRFGSKLKTIIGAAREQVVDLIGAFLRPARRKATTLRFRPSLNQTPQNATLSLQLSNIPRF